MRDEAYKNMTFLFCDIRGFTPISEGYKDNPEGLVELINRFLTNQTDIILQYGGTIDKYMGDCIMAFWNAPIDNPNHAEDAVNAALHMRLELAELNNVLQHEGGILLLDYQDGWTVECPTAIVPQLWP